MPIEKQKLILISGIALGLVVVVMVKMYLDQQQQAVREQAKKAIANMQVNQTAVLIAKQDIPKGSMIESAPLDTSVVPNKFVQPQAVTSLSRISGMITVADISQGEQVTLTKLATSKQAGGDLAGLTPAGKRAISIAVDNLSSLAGMIKPGDYVDVIATLQIPMQNAEGQQGSQIAVLSLFQNVLVLAMGQNTGGPVASRGRGETVETTGGGVAPLVTLALTPQEASFAAFVQEQGKIRFTLRSPADAKIEPITPANLNTLFQYIMPQQQAQAVSQETQEEEPKIETIEIYRGASKERIPLSK
ncbi:MAG: Flp pilus assembly protein CpaB [Candidatus Omnitrophota bacterium]|nr:Flp pilus assembly protein CpaB [Candidatus Omnitrophota bacterium]